LSSCENVLVSAADPEVEARGEGAMGEWSAKGVRLKAPKVLKGWFVGGSFTDLGDIWRGAVPLPQKTF